MEVDSFAYLYKWFCRDGFTMWTESDSNRVWFVYPASDHNQYFNGWDVEQAFLFEHIVDRRG